MKFPIFKEPHDNIFFFGEKNRQIFVKRENRLINGKSGLVTNEFEWDFEEQTHQYYANELKRKRHQKSEKDLAPSVTMTKELKKGHRKTPKERKKLQLEKRVACLISFSG